MPLYHFQTGFPARFQPPVGNFRLHYGPHARRAARDDRYDDLTGLLPTSLDTGKAKLIEIEQDERGRTTKLVYRVPMHTRLDLVLVISPDKATWFVRTVWANDCGDQHNTLDERKCVRVAC